MVKVILHAGLPKTGSTSIQAAFAANRERLAAAGFFYPDFDLPGPRFSIPGHWQLGVLWRERMEPHYHLLRRFEHYGAAEAVDEEIRRRLLRTIRLAREFGDGVVVLSDEHMSQPEAVIGLRRLSGILERNGATLEALAYLRPDPDLYASQAQQHIKQYGRRLEIDRLSHLPLVDALERGLGPERLSVRIFSPQALAGGDAVADLSGWIAGRCGREFPAVEESPRENESVPGPGCALMLRLNEKARLGDRNPAFDRMRWATTNSLADIAAPKLKVPEAWRPRIEAQVRDRFNAWVARSDHGPELRQRLAMPDPGALAPVSQDEFRALILQAWDPAYNRALGDWLIRRASIDPRGAHLLEPTLALIESAGT